MAVKMQTRMPSATSPYDRVGAQFIAPIHPDRYAARKPPSIGTAAPWT